MDDVWEENCSHAINLNLVKDLYDMNEHTFIVWDANNKSHTWKVYYFDNKPTEYECCIFTSSKVRLNKLQLSFRKIYLLTNIIFYIYFIKDSLQMCIKNL